MKCADDTKRGKNANRGQQINDIKGMGDIRKLSTKSPKQFTKKKKGKQTPGLIGMYIYWPSVFLIEFQGIVERRPDGGER